MRAVIFHGKHDLRVEDRPIPAVGPDEVLIKVAFCGICGSDVHTFEGMQMNIHGGRRPGPRPMGHEISGGVERIGEGVTNCAPGDRVTCIPWVTCGTCYYCRRGLVNHCPKKRQLVGGMADYALTPAGTVHKIPDSLSMERAALAEPLSCCLWAIDLAGIASGASVAIIGAGTMGLLMLQLAQVSGAARTIISEPHATRRAVAERLGADRVVDPRAEDLVAAVHELTDGIGSDAALEAVGHPATVQSALDVVRRAGTVVIVGVADPEARLEISPFDLYLREITLKGCFTRRLSFDRGLPWLAKLDLDPILTHVYPLEQIGEAMEVARTGKGAKVLIRP